MNKKYFVSKSFKKCIEFIKNENVNISDFQLELFKKQGIFINNDYMICHDPYKMIH